MCQDLLYEQLSFVTRSLSDDIMSRCKFKKFLDQKLKLTKKLQVKTKIKK